MSYESLYWYKANVSRVVDGDTVDAIVDLGFHTFAVHRFRLMGYNAPELRGSERSKGKVASHALEELLLPHSEVLIKTYKADSFGRYLADIFLPSGRSVVEKLLHEGYGVRWDGKGKRPGFPEGQEYPLKPSGSAPER